jgi:protein-S-isoprenylcysteine O-methyltransferase Ste14
MLALEIGERLLLLMLYYGFASRLLTDFTHSGNIADALILASESFVVLLAMVRRPAKDVSFRPEDLLLALGGSLLPLLLAPAKVAPLGPGWIGWALQTAAFVGQLAAKLFLFRNFGVAPALRGVAVRGPYAIIRHPMYAAYFISQLGFLYAFPTLWNALLILVWTGAQVLRMFAEERVLKRAPDYRDYAARVRWRVIPGLF